MRRSSQSSPMTSGRRRKRRVPITRLPRLAELESRFARFRQEHPRGTRVPEDLRAAALAALREGLEPGALNRSCGVSSKQLIAWQGGYRAAPAKLAAAESSDVRAFSVVDEPNREPTAAQELELRLGPWSISVRLTDPRAAERG